MLKNIQIIQKIEQHIFLHSKEGGLGGATQVRKRLNCVHVQNHKMSFCCLKFLQGVWAVEMVERSNAL
jgi:hypothetical protein